MTYGLVKLLNPDDAEEYNLAVPLYIVIWSNFIRDWLA
jgi:hypothetical protein